MFEITKLTLIKGAFHPETGIPDGDSVRFEPDNPEIMKIIPGVRWIKHQRMIQLRYEGIDALEKTAVLPHSQDARDFNLYLLSGDKQNLKRPSRGYILTGFGEGRGRPVALVFTGATARTDGSRIHVKDIPVKESVNYRMIRAGMAYPLFYETLSSVLRKAFIRAYLAGKSQRGGHLRLDSSLKGIVYTGKAGLRRAAPIFPKLYRRLFDYNKTDPAGFIDWMTIKKPEALFLISKNKVVTFSGIIRVKSDTIRLRFAPGDMIFKPKMSKKIIHALMNQSD